MESAEAQAEEERSYDNRAEELVRACGGIRRLGTSRRC